MPCKKIVFLISFLAIFGFLFGLNTPTAKAMSVSEIQALIQQLQSQIAELQKQLSEAQGQPATWCHDFNTNLRYGDKGTEVEALQTALQKEGLSIGENKDTGVFEDYTASAVVEFQEKYYNDILQPYGLKRGTGFVGTSTRTKLNQLFNCGVTTSTTTITPAPTSSASTSTVSTTPTISATPTPTMPTTTTTTTQTPVSGASVKPTPQPYIQLAIPNGSERWVIGNTYNIKWKSSKISKVDIWLIGADQKWQISSSFPVPEGEGQYFWTISGVNSGHYRIKMWDSTSPTTFDESDLLFWVVSSAATCADSDNGKDYSVKGTTSGVATNGATVTNSDSCGTCGTATGGSAACVHEWFCSNNFAEDTYYVCPSDHVCRDGTCQKAEKPINILSPNGGEQWSIGNTYTVKWEVTSSVVAVNFELYKGGAYFGGLGGMSPAPTFFSWDTVNTSNLIPGSDYKIRITSTKDQTIYDESDNYFSITTSLPSPATCNDLKSYSATNYYLDSCKKEGYDRTCFNKYYSTYQGCGRSFVYDDCTTHNVNADKNIWCDTGLIYTCADSDNTKDYYKPGVVTDEGKIYSDFCVDSSTLKEYFCSVSDAYPSGTLGEENYTCPSGCENGVCKQTAE